MKHGDGGKGDARRPEAERGAFERGYDAIVWHPDEEPVVEDGDDPRGD